MGIKFDPISQTYEVSYSKRHPITRMPKRIARNGIKTNAEAQRVLRQLVVELERAFNNTSPGSMTYQELLKRFYQSLVDRDLTPKTIENYTLCLDAHTSKLWGSRKIETISPEEIRQLVKVTLGNRSPSHQKSMLKFIRGVFTYAIETNLLQRNPVPRMQFRLGDKIKAVLTEQQLGIFLEKAKQYDHEWYPIWVTAVYTGCRNGELHALTWDKVDLENRTILISASWNKKDGLKDLTKSGDDRMIEIAPTLLTILRELKLLNTDTVFVLPRIEEWDDGRQAEILRMFLLGINLPRIRFHDLRASWATVCLGKGIEPVKVMAMGGWKDLKTMMIYIRKAGISIRGMTDGLSLHNPSREEATVLKIPDRSRT
ncbi:MAG: site-specific integrase [Bdellovibrionia bacterium]